MISYGHINMIIVDSCMILFCFDCTMQFKKSYHIATNVCSRKSATTFGDRPDIWRVTIWNTFTWKMYGMDITHSYGKTQDIFSLRVDMIS